MPLPPDVERDTLPESPPAPPPPLTLLTVGAAPGLDPQTPVLTGGDDAGGALPQALFLVGGDLHAEPQLTCPP